MYKLLSILSRILLIFNAVSGMLIIACIVYGGWFYLLIPFILLAVGFILKFYFKYNDNESMRINKRNEILDKLGIK
jgi:hypothetical protein